MLDVIAYFSMEIGLETAIPTYAGGLGMLAGDAVRSAADLEIPMVAITLAHRKGYLRQTIDPAGQQIETRAEWSPETMLEPVEPRVMVTLEDRQVWIRSWRYRVQGENGSEVPVYLLDTDLPENSPDDRRLTDQLYGGDDRHRLSQEVVLGIGGVKLLRALGHLRITRLHLNEGHAALIVLALLEERLIEQDRVDPDPATLESIRERCVFTTHTPVAAGHDRFSVQTVKQVLGPRRQQMLEELLGTTGLDMTELGLRGAGFVNGVAMRHWQVSQDMFPGHHIHPITNGVHVPTWTAPSMQALFDEFLPNWRRDSLALRYAIVIPDRELWSAHRTAKRDLSEEIQRRSGESLDLEALTLGFARRATAYKRAQLLFHDIERLRALARTVGPLQLVFAGKAHPRDTGGKDIIRRIHEAKAALAPEVHLVYVPDYDMSLGRLLCSGVDVWLNTPLPPWEASGTSGMKAAINGVPSLSVLDGWWVEGHAEGLTGWSIGVPHDVDEPPERSDEADAHSLYDKLERIVAPSYFRQRAQFIHVMRHAIALNGSHFNSQRMMWQYLRSAYQPK